MLAVGAAAVIEIEHRAADGALFARQSARCVGREKAGGGLRRICCARKFVAAGLKEFKLAAFGAGVKCYSSY